MSATHGRSNLLVSGVKTRRRLDAGEPDMAEGLGFIALATIRAAEATYAKPRLARIQWDTRETVGWSELAGAKLAAAAGARLERQRG